MKKFFSVNSNDDVTQYIFYVHGKTYSIYKINPAYSSYEEFRTSGYLNDSSEEEKVRNVNRVLSKIPGIQECTAEELIKVVSDNVKKLEKKAPKRIEKQKQEIIKILADSFQSYVGDFGFPSHRAQGILDGIHIHVNSGSKFFSSEKNNVWFSYGYDVRRASGYDSNKIIEAMNYVTEWMSLNSSRKVNKNKSFNAHLILNISVNKEACQALNIDDIYYAMNLAAAMKILKD